MLVVPHGRRSLASVAGFVLLTVAVGFAGLHLVVAPLAPFFPSWPLQSSRFSQQRPPPATYHNYTSAFSFDLNETSSGAANYSYEAWMARVPDATPLTRLSIPGTHDTFTYNLTDNVVFQCQNHDLPTQLRAGLRYFDVRGRLVVPASTSQQQAAAGADPDPVIGIFHGHVPTGHTFEDVLLTLFAYLDAHPSEGVVLRVKEEGAPVYQEPDPSPPEENADWRTGGYNTTFEEAFNHYRTNNTRTAPGCARHLLMPWPPLLADSASDRVMPTMGQLRGRILVLYEFPVASAATGTPAPYGIPWDTPPYTSLEDLWVIPDAAHLDDKWAAVRAHLEEVAAAGDDQGNDDTLFLTHLSASTGVTPIEAAAGPLGDAARRPPPDGSLIRGINDRTGLWLEAEDEDDRNRRLPQDAFRKTGIVMADFPGRRLVEDILGRNEWLDEKEPSSSSS